MKTKPEKCIIYDDYYEDELENVPSKYRDKTRKKDKQKKIKKMKRNDY